MKCVAVWSPLRSAYREEPLRGHRQRGVDGAVLADVSHWVDVGEQQGEHVESVTAKHW